jgi:toxin ParE1/3/4
MRIRYTPRALAELEAIFDYLYDRSPSAATAVLKTIRARIAQLEHYPFIGVPTKKPGTRSLTVTQYPYKVYYRARGSIISIVHIRDSRRSPWRGYH